MEARNQFNDLLFGSNGSGKTTIMVNLAVMYMRNNPKKRVLFVLTDDGEEKLDPIPEIAINQVPTFTGVKKILIENEKMFAEFVEMFASKESTVKFDGLMIPDDIGAVIGRRPLNVLKLFKRRRQANIDFLWSFHGFRTDMPPLFFTYVNRIYVGETSDNHNWTKDLLPEHKQEEFDKLYYGVIEKLKQKKYYFGEMVIKPTNK